ncbi:hypothetical protein [Serratia marcescens]|uniref:hypothetical protein n=1 Tax=Serratia marcescens TaxID=615 RepID=UPI003FA7BA82
MRGLLKNTEILFNLFSLGFARKALGVALPGGVFCRKSELKKFPDPNCAGGCGVVPFSSKIPFLRLA